MRATAAALLCAALLGCSGSPDDQGSKPPPTSASGALTLGATLVFGADYSETVVGSLAAGRGARVAFDPARLPQCRGTSNGYEQWAISGYYRLNGGAVQAFDVPRSGGSALPAITLPESGDLELWFQNTNRWGCSQFDSDYGKNYHFTVAPAQPAAVTRGPDGVANGPVAVIDAAPWQNDLSCSHGFCTSEFHFWVDLAVENRAYDKSVGIVWTSDNWATVQTAQASHEGSHSDGRERWGVELSLGTGTQRPGEIQYAGFATMGGQTYWDADDNHYVYTGVTPPRPVRLLAAQVDHAVDHGGVLSGSVRALHGFGEAAEVTVRTSTDGWATFRDTPATLQGEAWAFRVEDLGGEALPDGVDFAVRLVRNGVEAWDNNGGQNHHRALRPRFSPSQQYTDGGQGLSGVLWFGGSYATDLTQQSIEARLDDGSWQPTSSLALSTEGLADGPHQVEFRALYRDGYTAQDAIAFTVQNRIQPLDAWAPPGPATSDQAPWDMAVDGSGRVFVLWPSTDGGVVTRHASFGDASAPQVIAAPDARSIAVDGAGRLYALSGAALTRFGASGALDAAFGSGGAVALGGSFDGAAVCYAGFVAAGPDGVDVVDTCNDRLLHFSDSGAFAGAVALPSAGDDGGALHFGAVARGAEGLWMFQPRQVTLFSAASGLPSYDAAHSVPFAAGASFDNRQGVARAADGGFWLLDEDRLLLVSAGGEARAQWLGGVSQSDLPGAIPVARQLVVLGDGSVAVLAADRSKIQRFAAELR